MEAQEVGRVLTTATIENLDDYVLAKAGHIADANVRRVTVEDALVDTGATLVSLPTKLIQELGLKKKYTRNIRAATAMANADVYGAIRLTIEGRDCLMDATEVPDGVPVHIGQLPLEWLDFVVDMREHKLIGNPAHGGEQMFEIL